MSSSERNLHRRGTRPEEQDAAFARWIALSWIAVAFVAGWVGLSRTAFWVDESIAIFPALGILTHGAPVAPYDLDFMPWQIKFDFWDPATPLYRYTLATVFSVFGFSELVARGFSWVVGFLALVPLHAVARTLFGRTTAWLGIALLAGSPAFGLFAREARHHTFVLLLASMMVWALLAASRQDAPGQRRMLWVLPLVGALLAQTIGYLALPVAALYVAYVGVRRFVSSARSSLIATGIAALLYGTVMAFFWHTLPFFHDVGCANRPAGCQPVPLYYVRVLYEFLSPITSREELFGLLQMNTGRFGLPARWTLATGPLLFVLGLFAAMIRSRVWPASKSAMVWIWLLVPLSLLSTQEAKFPRFLFVWTIPIAVLITAFGATWLAGKVQPAWPRRAVLASLFGLLVLAPQWTQGGRSSDSEERGSFGLVRYFHRQIWDAPSDNWYRTRAKVTYLESRVGDGDEVVTSFDDAGLRYYLGRFVHGFLNSRHDDEYFMELLREAERRDRVVWFVDTLPDINFCLSRDAEPVSVDCRQKYPTFYRTCFGIAGELRHRCRRVSHWELRDVR